MIRQPIVVLVGHIDHGKSSILENIRGISITKAEAGGITQSIKSYNISLKAIKQACGDLLKNIKTRITLPGLLFLDSPGHAAFNNMRKRGGNLADIAIIVIDINEGVKEQTLECLEILKHYKTPFIIALNKIDKIHGWSSNKNKSLMENINSLPENIKQEIDKKLYEILGVLAEKGFDSERFDRIKDYTKQISMVPVSAKTSEGIPELLMVLTGLAQKYLEQSLETMADGEGKATVLEVEEEEGMGTTLDIILYDGSIKQNDQIVIGTLGNPIITKVKGLFEPKANKLAPIKQINAAYGVKLSAPNIKEVIGGMPLIVANKDIEKKKKEVMKEVESVLIDTDKEGIIVKADTLGSLEALVNLLKKEEILIKKASIGNITKKDLAEASSEKNNLNKVILGFNIKETETNPNIKVIASEVIYKIIEDFKKWKETQTKIEEAKKLEGVVRPFRIKILRGHIFRQSNPAVVGVIIEQGTLKTNANLIKKDGSKASNIKSIQQDGENVNEAEIGKEVAVSIPNLIVGRQIKEDDTLYSDMTEIEFRELKNLKKLLSPQEIGTLKEIMQIKRKENPLWGV
tara:strand:- start:1327 stop:3048 length:1722 start_codon:yes stop_codon:yes gene_type:complete